MIATQFAPVFVMPLLLFGGLFTNNKTTPVWLAWLPYVSPIAYCAESLLDIEFKNDPYNQGDKLRTFLDYHLGYNTNFLIFAGLIIGLRILAFIFFKLLVNKV